jgi:hypothetical protein
VGMAWRLASRMGMAWRLASLGLGPALGLGSALGLWLRTSLALLVDSLGFPPLRVGLSPACRRLSAA